MVSDDDIDNLLKEIDDILADDRQNNDEEETWTEDKADTEKTDRYEDGHQKIAGGAFLDLDETRELNTTQARTVEQQQAIEDANNKLNKHGKSAESEVEGNSENKANNVTAGKKIESEVDQNMQKALDEVQDSLKTQEFIRDNKITAAKAKGEAPTNLSRAQSNDGFQR